MPETSADYPKIFVGSSELSNEALLKAIKEHLTDDKLSPSFSPFNFFDPDIIHNEQALLKVAEADFCMFLFSKDDLQKLQEQSTSSIQRKRDALMFLCGYFLGTLGSERILYAKPPNVEIPLFTDQKGIDVTTFNPLKGELHKSLRIVCNKLYRKVNELGIRDTQVFTKDPEEILDHLTHYSIQIFNTEGDAFITRKIRMEAKEDNVNQREHRIFSDTTPSKFNSINLKAWDENGRELSIGKIYDTPVKKEFTILFRNQLSKGEQLTYTYAFHWKGMFPPDGSNFSLKSTAKKILFDLIIPNSWDLLYARTIEKRRDGTPSKNMASFKLIKETQEEEFIRYSYQLKEIKGNILETQVFWEWKLKE